MRMNSAASFLVSQQQGVCLAQVEVINVGRSELAAGFETIALSRILSVGIEAV
jgi:hypothetical protein